MVKISLDIENSNVKAMKGQTHWPHSVYAKCGSETSDICLTMLCNPLWNCSVNVRQRSDMSGRLTYFSDTAHLRPGVQSISLRFVSWQSDHFGLICSKFHIWPWKFKVKVMAKVKSDGHIWGLGFNRYVCFLFRGNRTIFGRDIANSIFDLEKSMSWPRSTPMVTFEALRSIDMFAFRFVAIAQFLAGI